MSAFTKPTAYKNLNTTTRIPPPSQPAEYTDQDGVTLAVSPNGDGKVLIELHNENQYLNIAFEPTQLITLWKHMVDATGLTPNEIKNRMEKRGLVLDPKPENLTRQQRRALERKKK